MLFVATRTAPRGGVFGWSASATTQAPERVRIGTRLAITYEAPIRIGRDVGLAHNCAILVVASGSVVTHDVPAGAIVAGVPARVVKMRKDLAT